MIKIGNAQGFWGDSPGAPQALIDQVPDLDFLTLDYLAEVSLSIMAVQRSKDPSLGYARDFLSVIDAIKGSKVRVVTNAGGLNPRACAEAIKKKAPEMKVGLVTGDDVLDLVEGNYTTANAYIGAEKVVEVLDEGAQVVVTGRVADPSLAVAACAHHFKWSLDEYDKIAGATIAGHLIECGTQVTGGFSTHWLEIPDPAGIGFPVVEVESDGSCTITKPPGTGGRVDIHSVKEQLLYEIGDPANYLSPDATVSFLGLQLEEVGEDRIYLKGALGRPPPLSYKVNATALEGYRAEGMITIYGEQAVRKARRAGEVVIEKVKRAGYALEETLIECLGAGDVVPGCTASDPIETVLRIAVFDSSREGPDRFARELAGLVTSGPQGTTGYASGRPKVRPVYGYTPLQVDRQQVNPTWEVL